jgi:hypothetical protein
VDEAFDIKLWERSYDAFNGNPEDNSDFDSERDDEFLKEKMKIDDSS